MKDMKPTLVIGVDGGGTCCRAAIGTRSKGVLGQAEGGRANATSDPALAVRNVIRTVKVAAENAGIPHADLSLAVAHIGLAGVMSPADSARIAAALPFALSTVTDDRPTAVAGALGAQSGYLISVGTGTFVAASSGGTLAFVGGWGFQVADQASGAWLGHEALKRTLLCHDSLSRHSGLTRDLMAQFSNNPNEIVSFAATARPSDYGTLAPTVVAAAHAGDAWGRAIMRDGADYLAQALAALNFTNGDALCLTGGVGPHYADYLPDEMLTGRVSSQGSALDGAFYLASVQATPAEGRAP